MNDVECCELDKCEDVLFLYEDRGEKKGNFEYDERCFERIKGV